MERTWLRMSGRRKATVAWMCVGCAASALLTQAPPTPDPKATLQKATENLARSGLADKALRDGAKVLDFTLPDAHGQPIRLSALVAKGPVVLTFYRGGWCPYCNLQLRSYQQALPEIHALGAELVAVSPQTPDKTLSTAEMDGLAFPVLSDAGNQVARKFGLVFRVPDEVYKAYRGFGIDLEASNGETTHELPMPGTYIIGQDWTIRFAFVNADYRVRLPAPRPQWRPPQGGPMKKSSVPERPVDRRAFCACALAATALACGGGGGGGGGTTLPPPSGGPKTTTDTKTFLLTQPPGTIRDYRNLGSFWLVRDSGGIYAMTAICTHQGCTVNGWNGSVFPCPCHGSQYDLNGTVVQGPAPLPLNHFEVTANANDLLVVDTGKVVGALVRLT